MPSVTFMAVQPASGDCSIVICGAPELFGFTDVTSNAVRGEPAAGARRGSAPSSDRPRSSSAAERADCHRGSATRRQTAVQAATENAGIMACNPLLLLAG